MPRFVPVLLLLGLLIAGCRDTPPDDAPGTLAPPDTLAADSTALLDTLLAVQDTTVAQADTLAPAAALDSLRAEIARLTGAVAALERRERDGLTGRLFRPDTTAAADTTATAERLRETAGQFGMRLVFAILLLLVTALVIRALVQLLETLAARSVTQRLFFKKLVPIVRLLLWSITVYIVLAGIFGLDRSSLLAAATALGVAIGFAAQDVLKNIFGGIIIIFDQPFQVGDKIRVSGTYGEVVSIGLRSTRIVTPDDNLVSVPNSQVVEGQVANANAGALDCQVVVDLFLPGWVDVRRAKAIAYEAAANSRYVYLEKPIVVNVRDEFRETFLTHLMVKAYVLDTRYEATLASDVTEAAKIEFMREGLLPPVGDVPLHPEQPNGQPR